MLERAPLPPLAIQGPLAAAPVTLLRGTAARPSNLKTGIWIAILAVAYLLTGWVGFRSGTFAGHSSIVWPLSGVALAAALTWGWSAAPGIWLVTLLLSLGSAGTIAWAEPSSYLVAGSISLGSTLQATVAALLIRRWVTGGIFSRPAAIIRFAGAAALTCVLAPTWSAITHSLVGGTARISLDSWSGWWLGDLTGMVVFAPLLLQWREILKVSRRKGWIGEAIGTCVAIVAIGTVVYFGWDSLGNPQYLLTFVTLPCVVWIAFRFRPPGVALTAAFVAAIAVGAMSHGALPLDGEIARESLLLFQAFSALVSVTGLALSSAITGQKRAEKAVRAERAQYIDLYENAPDMFASVDIATEKITDCNQTLATVLGLTKQEIVGRSIFDLYHRDTREVARRAFQSFRITGTCPFFESTLARRNGNKVDVSVTASAVRDASGCIVSSRTAWRDITARKLAERTLQESQGLWRMFIEQAPVAIAMFDKSMRYLAVSKRFLRDSGFPPETELYGASHHAVFPAMPEHWKAAHRRALAGEVVTVDEDRIEKPDGTVQWLRWEVRPWYDVVGLGGVVVFSEDVSRRKQASEDLLKLNAELETRVRERTTELERLAREMEAQSLTDQLTGLPNRRALDHKLAVEVRLSLRHKVPLALLMIDVDHFKQYNDSFGHPAGDEVLRAVARALETSTRTTDYVARWGGEEFAVLLRHTDEEGARVVAERIRETVATGPWTHRAVTVSIGAARVGGYMTDVAGVLTEADRALYEAKRRGRDCVVTASEPPPDADDRQHQKSA